MKLHKEKILKIKKFKDCFICIYNPYPREYSLLCISEEKIVKVKMYFVGDNKKAEKSALKYIRSEYRKWINIKYKLGYLTPDDEDFFIIKNIDK